MPQLRFGYGKAFLPALVAGCTIVCLADGYGWCVEYWNWDGKRSNIRDGRRWPAGDGAVISYINGIFHSIPEWEKITGQLEALFGHEIRPFYNPSSGWWITDASKAGYHLLRKPANDSIAQALGEHLAQAVEDVGRGRVLHIAHSGGALITYLAAQNHLTRRQRDKIDVLTFGGARSITRKYFSGRIVNYYARNDPLVKLDRRAAELMRLTSNTTVQAVFDKHNTTFVFLEGRAKQFVLDHSLEGPTYQQVLRREARAFRRSHFGPLSPLSWDYDTSLVRLVRKRMARVSGIRHFLSAEYWSIRSWPKSMARFTGLSGFFGSKASDDESGKRMVDADMVTRAQRPEESPWFYKRWDWPQRKGSDQPEGAQDGSALMIIGHDDSEPVSVQPSRWFLGWRWYPSATKQDLEQEASMVDDAATSPAMGAAVKLVPNSEKSNIGRLWNIWGSQPKGTLEAEPDSEDVLSDSEEGDALGGSGNRQVLSEGSSELKENSSADIDSSKPWLALGWISWGAARRPNAGGVDVGVDTLLINGEPGEQMSAGENEGGADVKAGEEAGSSGDARRAKKALPMARKSESTPADKGQSSPWSSNRWWSSTSQREVTPATSKEVGVNDEVDEVKSSISDDDGEIEEAQPTVQKNKNILVEEGQSSLRPGGWWWSGSSRRDIPPAEENVADVVEEGEGNITSLGVCGDGNVDGDMGIGRVEEEVNVAPSVMAEETGINRETVQARPLLRRWWPLQTPEEATTPGTDVVRETVAVEDSGELDLFTAPAQDEKYPQDKSELRETEATVVDESQHPSSTSTAPTSSQPAAGWRLWSVFKGDTTDGTDGPQSWTDVTPDTSASSDEGEQSGDRRVGGTLDEERITGEVIWRDGRDDMAAAEEWPGDVQLGVKEAVEGQGSGDDDGGDGEDSEDSENGDDGNYNDDDEDDEDAGGGEDDEKKKTDKESGSSPAASVPSVGEAEVLTRLAANGPQFGAEGDVPGDLQSELARQRNGDGGMREADNASAGGNWLAETGDEAARNGQQEDGDDDATVVNVIKQKAGGKPTDLLEPDLPPVATVNRVKASASADDPDER